MAKATALKKVSRRRRILRGLSLLILALAATNLAVGTPTKSLLHRHAPAFVRHDLQGHSVRLRAYRGKVVLLNFWATWCAPCLEELPHFEAWQTRYARNGFQAIAVSMDDTDAPVRALASKLQLTIPVVMGDAPLGDRYGGILGLPITFLIDRRGMVVARFEGATDLDALERQVCQLLARH